MPSETAERFMRVWKDFERDGDPVPLAALFADDAEVLIPSPGGAVRGPQAAVQYGNAYRAAYREIHSDFTSVVEYEGRVVLEWDAWGASPDGRPITCKGVSILETADGRVRRFRTFTQAPATGIR